MRRVPSLGLVLAALLIRVAFLLAEPPAQKVGDEGLWRQMGREIASEPVDFSPFRSRLISHPPLYPYFLACLLHVFGTFQSVKWAQVVLGALLVLAVARVADRLAGPRAGLAAGMLTAVFPELVWHCGHFWSEALFVPLLWWAFELTLMADERGRAPAAAGAGVLWGLATLTRETVFFFAPLPALWLAWRRPRRVGVGGAFLLACLATVGPWTWRNHVLFGSFVPVATRGGFMLLLGNVDRPWEEVATEYRELGPVERQQRAMVDALRQATKHPLSWYPRKAWREVAEFWGVNSLAIIHLEKQAYGPLPVTTNIAAGALVIIPYLVVMGLAVVGLAGGPFDRRHVLLLGFLVGYTSLHVLAFGFPRFRLPVVPILLVWSAEAWARLRERRRLGRRRRWLAAALGLGAALVVLPSLRDTVCDPTFRPARPVESGP